MNPPITQDSCSSVSERANAEVRWRSGTSRWTVASSDDLAHRLGHAGRETEGDRRDQPVEDRRHDGGGGVREQGDHHRDRGRDLAQHRPEPDADGVAEPGGADDQPHQQGGPVLPAGKRMLAQQEGHVHRQEARQHPQPGVAAQREHHVGRHPELALVAAQADRQLVARARRPWPAAGSRGSSRPRTPRRRSAATTGTRTSRPGRPAARRSLHRRRRPARSGCSP